MLTLGQTLTAGVSLPEAMSCPHACRHPGRRPSVMAPDPRPGVSEAERQGLRPLAVAVRRGAAPLSSVVIPLLAQGCPTDGRRGAPPAGPQGGGGEH